MVQHRTILKVADNTGAKTLMVIQIYGGHKRHFARLGATLGCVVKKAEPAGTVKKGELVKAVLARTKKEFRRPDGSYIRFDDNAAILIDNLKDKNPRGTRIFGPIARELREAGFAKIISMAQEVL